MGRILPVRKLRFPGLCQSALMKYDILPYLSLLLGVYLLLARRCTWLCPKLLTGETIMSKARLFVSILLVLFVTFATVLFVIY